MPLWFPLLHFLSVLPSVPPPSGPVCVPLRQPSRKPRQALKVMRWTRRAHRSGTRWFAGLPIPRRTPALTPGGPCFWRTPWESSARPVWLRRPTWLSGSKAESVSRTASLPPPNATTRLDLELSSHAPVRSSSGARDFMMRVSSRTFAPARLFDRRLRCGAISAACCRSG